MLAEGERNLPVPLRDRAVNVVMAALHLSLLLGDQAVIPFHHDRAGVIQRLHQFNQAGDMLLVVIASVHPAHLVLHTPQNDRRMILVPLHQPLHMRAAIADEIGMSRIHAFAGAVDGRLIDNQHPLLIGNPQII